MSETETDTETKREETEIREKLHWLLGEGYELKKNKGGYYVKRSGEEYEGDTMMEFQGMTTIKSIEESGIDVLGVEAKGDVARILLNV